MRASGWMVLGAVAAALFLGGAARAGDPSASPSPLPGQRQTRDLGFPFPVGGRSLAQGRGIFLRHCASCHGRQGHGQGRRSAHLHQRPVDLGDAGAYRYGTQHQEIFRSIRYGVPGTAMGPQGPARGARLSVPDLWKVTAYVMSLAWQPVTRSLPGGLKVAILRPGQGAGASPGQQVVVNYIGWLTTGRKFDSSYDRGKPFKFTLGAHQVIPGWDEGVQGMKVGELRQLVIPPSLAYGQRGAGPIPPDATLVFQVQLMGLK